ncbi:hypothetical protein [Pseudoalteromonas aurantia]|uniref:Uncharacterized protein n=1 Tax=Pseudoalteromonas aurantia TaxID=43654 RepID=A0A5S3V5Z9_9GAMM|nr:hypothetical protein [Pseudoalteromonas aurantia]TMO66632.1 hypothetical protein CWC19_15825 [Pseudoalteromonas aurantia]
MQTITKNGLRVCMQLLRLQQWHKQAYIMDLNEVVQKIREIQASINDLKAKERAHAIEHKASLVCPEIAISTMSHLHSISIELNRLHQELSTLKASEIVIEKKISVSEMKSSAIQNKLDGLNLQNKLDSEAVSQHELEQLWLLNRGKNND